MKNLLPIFLVLLLSSPVAHAQELTFAPASSSQIKTVGLSKAPVISFYNGYRKRTPGTIGMILGGSMLVAGPCMIVIYSHAQSAGDGLFYGGLFSFELGIPTFLISGLVHLVSESGNRYYSSHISIYSDPNHLGLAYNF